MLRSATLALLLALALLLTHCKSADPVTPVPTATELLSRNWLFDSFVVKTEAKQYTITVPQSRTSTADAWTFASNGTYSYPESGARRSGKWAFSNGDKTLTTIDADNYTSVFEVTALTTTALELSSQAVDVTKGTDFTDSNVYTLQEQDIIYTSRFLILSLDKQYGGTLDITNEPQPKRLQFVQRGRSI